MSHLFNFFNGKQGLSEVAKLRNEGKGATAKRTRVPGAWDPSLATGPRGQGGQQTLGTVAVRSSWPATLFAARRTEGTNFSSPSRRKTARPARGGLFPAWPLSVTKFSLNSFCKRLSINLLKQDICVSL